MKKSTLKEHLKPILQELEGKKSNIMIGGKPFKLRLDVNKNPTKKGIKIQFVPLGIDPEGDIGADKVDRVQKDDLAIELLSKLNEGLRKYGLEADLDPDVPFKNVIGVYIHLQYFDKIIRNILSPQSTTNDEEIQDEQ